MRGKRTALIVCAVMVFAAVWLGKTLAPPQKNPEDPYIYDGANALLPDTRQKIRDLNVGSERKVYVICVNKTGRYSLKAYAERTARDWKISDNDALVVFRTEKGGFKAVWGDYISDAAMEKTENDVARALSESVDKAALTFVTETKAISERAEKKSFFSTLLEKISTSVVWFAVALTGVIIILKIIFGKN